MCTWDVLDQSSGGGVLFVDVCAWTFTRVTESCFGRRHMAMVAMVNVHIQY